MYDIAPGTMCFQQNAAARHTANATIDLLTSLDYLLWVYVNSLVLATVDANMFVLFVTEDQHEKVAQNHFQMLSHILFFFFLIKIQFFVI